MFQVPQMFFVSQSVSQEQICIYRTEDKIRTWKDATSKKQLRVTVRPETQLNLTMWWSHVFQTSAELQLDCKKVTSKCQICINVTTYYYFCICALLIQKGKHNSVLKLKS